MPRQQEQSLLAAVPEQFADFILPTGDTQNFKVHVDNNGEKGILCDLCGSFFKLTPTGKTSYLKGHRNKQRCKDEAERRLRARERKRERAEEEALEDQLHCQIFHEQIGASLSESNSPFQTPVNLTPRQSHANLRRSESTSTYTSQSVSLSARDRSVVGNFE